MDAEIINEVRKDIVDGHGPVHQMAAPPAVKETAVAVPVKERPGVSVYVWKHGKMMFLSAKETVLAEEFLKTHKYAAAARKLKSEMGYEISPLTVERWIKSKKHMQDWIAQEECERGMAVGWTPQHWLYVMTRHLQGIEVLKSVDVYVLKLIGEHKGWGKDVGGVNTNVQINFTERAA